MKKVLLFVVIVLVLRVVESFRRISLTNIRSLLSSSSSSDVSLLSKESSQQQSKKEKELSVLQRVSRAVNFYQGISSLSSSSSS